MNKIAIVGAGPAGIATALQLTRFGLPVTLIEKDKVGGLLRNANLVENYPGFPNGVSGPSLVGLFEKQLQRIGVELTVDEIMRINLEGGNFLLEGKRVDYECETLVIASGTKPKAYPVEIPKNAQESVFSEVFPLRDVLGKGILIVGAGDAAFDYALNLAKKGNSVTILNRGRDVKCLSLLYERVEAEPSVVYLDSIAVSQVVANKTAGSLTVRCERAGRILSLETDYLLFAIGREPELDFLTPELIEAKDRLQADGKLYFIGDVVNGLMRQTAIAAGDGLRTAMQIYFNYRRLEK